MKTASVEMIAKASIQGFFQWSKRTQAMTAQMRLKTQASPAAAKAHSQ